MADPNDSDDGMDALMDNFKVHRYKNGFSESNWEEEFNKVPMFMKTAPEEIDPKEYPELACLQAIIHDEDRPPQEQALSLKDEGNAFFKEKNYQKAILSYTAALKKQSGDQELDTVLLTNRAAAQFHLGNMRSALNDAGAARKIKPDHLKAFIRGAQCCVELRRFADAIQWCDEGLKAHPTDKKLQELRAAADKHKRAAERDARKAKAKEKRLHGEKEVLLKAIKDRGIKLAPKSSSSSTRRRHGSDSEEDEAGGSASAAIAELSLDGLSSQEAAGAQVFLDGDGALHWPVFFLYPEHQQSDFVSAFCENNSFLEQLAVMFGEELPPWDADRKYRPEKLQLFFEDEEKETLYEVALHTPLLTTLQHKRFFVKAGTPSFIALVRGSSFRKQFLTGKKIQGL